MDWPDIHNWYKKKVWAFSTSLPDWLWTAFGVGVEEEGSHFAMTWPEGLRIASASACFTAPRFELSRFCPGGQAKRFLCKCPEGPYKDRYYLFIFLYEILLFCGIWLRKMLFLCNRKTSAFLPDWSGLPSREGQCLRRSCRRHCFFDFTRWIRNSRKTSSVQLAALMGHWSRRQTIELSVSCFRRRNIIDWNLNRFLLTLPAKALVQRITLQI